MSQIQIQKLRESLLIYCLKRIYGLPASLTVITGLWKTGKTDFALLLSELLTQIKRPNYSHKATLGFSEPLIHQVASNIETPDQRIEYITSLSELKIWLHEKKNKRKLFILDEINKIYSKRRAMSQINVETLKVFGELSKARAHLILVGQDILETDSEFLNPTWCRAIWFKTRLKSVQLNSHLIEGQKTFFNLPRTSIKFDPYKIAPMTEYKANVSLFKEKDKNLIYQWATGTPSRELGLHPQQLNRIVRKFCSQILTSQIENPNK